MLLLGGSLGHCPLPFHSPAWVGDQKVKHRYVWIPPSVLLVSVPRPGEEHRPHARPPGIVPTPHSPAAVQPHVPAPQPGPMVLVLVGGEVLDDGRLPGLQRVGVLVGAVSGTQHGEAQVAVLGGPLS